MKYFIKNIKIGKTDKYFLFGLFIYRYIYNFKIKHVINIRVFSSDKYMVYIV